MGNIKIIKGEFTTRLELIRAEVAVNSLGTRLNESSLTQNRLSLYQCQQAVPEEWQ